MEHTIAILHMPGCPGARQAIRIAHELASIRDDLAVETTTIETDGQARALPFRGSPTVLVDGVDIEPEPQAPVGSLG